MGRLSKRQRASRATAAEREAKRARLSKSGLGAEVDFLSIGLDQPSNSAQQVANEVLEEAKAEEEESGYESEIEISDDDDLDETVVAAGFSE